MDNKEKQLFTTIWSLAVKEHQLLGDVLPTVHEIVKTLSNGETPTSEQLQAWLGKHHEMNQKLDELTAIFLEARQICDPLFGYDS